MARVENEVAFGLENLGTAPAEIWPRADVALASVDAIHLADRRTFELSGGELQRVVPGIGARGATAAHPARRADLPARPRRTAERFLAACEGLGIAVVLSEQRIDRALPLATRVLFVEDGGCSWTRLVTRPATGSLRAARGTRPARQ